MRIKKSFTYCETCKCFTLKYKTKNRTLLRCQMCRKDIQYYNDFIIEHKVKLYAPRYFYQSY